MSMESDESIGKVGLLSDTIWNEPYYTIYLVGNELYISIKDTNKLYGPFNKVITLQGIIAIGIRINEQLIFRRGLRGVAKKTNINLNSNTSIGILGLIDFELELLATNEEFNLLKNKEYHSTQYFCHLSDYHNFAVGICYSDTGTEFIGRTFNFYASYQVTVVHRLYETHLRIKYYADREYRGIWSTCSNSWIQELA